MPESTRSSILRAALTCAEEAGWASTSMQRVRLRAGVSNGSLFHHFPSREALVSAVLAEGLAEHQTLLADLLGQADTARGGIEEVVVAHLGWMVDHRELAELMLFTRADVLRASLTEEAVEANQIFFRGVEVWLRAHGWTGQPDLPVLLAMWTGPSQEYARRWLTGQVADPSEAATDLAAGAWRSLSLCLVTREQ